MMKMWHFISDSNDRDDVFLPPTQAVNNLAMDLTHTHNFIRYTLLLPGWTPFCLQNCLNSSWHRFNKVLETLLRDFGSYCHE